MTPIDKDAVLDAFAAEPVHERNTLQRYITRYPELAEDLIDLASELRLSDDLAGVHEGILSDPKLNTAWEDFLAATPKQVAPAVVMDFFAQFKGVAFAALAEKLDIPRSLLTAVRDRLVVPATVPANFLRRFADAMGTTIDAAKAYIAQDSQAPLGLEFKSERKPANQGQATFRQLVETTEMSESQRLFLLQECEEHEPI